ncbi:cell surface protein [Loigolactobacillus backii]|uniref:C40 family peptidase n=1 Tax=Loigolactobacillus backii TaxID=375175 RepID=UPI000C1C9F65|nr:C40 family peptidase [Loigolactobacillus backii]PIO83105.1 cell surface protein [Loigolactobacillus backii]
MTKAKSKNHFSTYVAAGVVGLAGAALVGTSQAQAATTKGKVNFQNGATTVWNNPSQGLTANHYLTSGQTVNVESQQQIAGETWYNVGNDQWVPAKYVTVAQQAATTAKKDTVTSKYQSGATTIWTSPTSGQPTGKYLTFKQTINVTAQKQVYGLTWYQIGTNQWVPSAYVALNDPELANTQVVTQSVSLTATATKSSTAANTTAAATPVSAATTSQASATPASSAEQSATSTTAASQAVTQATATSAANSSQTAATSAANASLAQAQSSAAAASQAVAQSAATSSANASLAVASSAAAASQAASQSAATLAANVSQAQSSAAATSQAVAQSAATSSANASQAAAQSAATSVANASQAAAQSAATSTANASSAAASQAAATSAANVSQTQTQSSAATEATNTVQTTQSSQASTTPVATTPSQSAASTASTTSNQSAVQKVIAAAQSQIGVPYVWGGHTANVGLDCSGLTSYAFSAAGISLPAYTVSQESAGQKVSISALQPGDLVFWGAAGATYHVALYIGGNQYIAAPQPGENVQVQSISSYFEPSFGVRVL